MEAGLDSLAAVEIRQRLSRELPGVNFHSMLIFDHPTVSDIVRFASSQLPPVAGQKVAAFETSAQAVQVPAVEPHIKLEALNDRSSGSPLFFVPGGPIQSDEILPLARLLPVPAYGFWWSRNAQPRERWPSLEELAGLFFDQVRVIQPEGPYYLIGYSLGANVVVEMARQAERFGEKVALVGLLDPRHLVPIASVIPEGVRLDLSLLAYQEYAHMIQTGVSASLHGSLAHEISKADEKDCDELLRRKFTQERFEMFKHLVATLSWMGCIVTAHQQTAEKLMTAKIVIFSAEDLQKDLPESMMWAQDVTESMRSTFQSDVEVAERVAAMTGAPAHRIVVPGDHFSMMSTPHNVELAIEICAALKESRH